MESKNPYKWPKYKVVTCGNIGNWVFVSPGPFCRQLWLAFFGAHLHVSTPSDLHAKLLLPHPGGIQQVGIVASAQGGPPALVVINGHRAPFLAKNFHGFHWGVVHSSEKTKTPVFSVVTGPPNIRKHKDRWLDPYLPFQGMCEAKWCARPRGKSDSQGGWNDQLEYAKHLPGAPISRMVNFSTLFLGTHFFGAPKVELPRVCMDVETKHMYNPQTSFLGFRV